MGEKVYDYIVFAEEEIEKGDYTLAESFYSVTLKECKTNKDFGEFYTSRARFHVKKNNIDYALADLRKAADYGRTDAIVKLKSYGVTYTPQNPASSGGSTAQPPKQTSAGFTGRQKKVYTDAEYDGEWLNGLFHGKGKMTWLDGETYEGDYVNGKRQGKGKYTYANGKVEEGRYENGEFIGK